MSNVREFNKADQTKFFKTGQTLDYAFRREMLIRFKEMIRKNERRIVEAIRADFGKAYFESYATEIMMIYDEINYMLKNLKKLMKPQKVGTSLTHFYSTSKIYKEPFGSVLIVAPWNYPFTLALTPAVGAIAAGNTVVIKPSEMTEHSSALMKEIIGNTFTSDYVAVVEGGADTTQDLIKQGFDYLFFTGSEQAGKAVMKTASDLLTPLTLELGGKSPAIVASDADLVKAAVRIAWGKTVNAGQTCIAPDYVLVHESVKKTFVRLLGEAFERLYGRDVFNNADFPSIINDKHFNRIKDLMKDEIILHGGQTNEKIRKIEPTLIDEPNLASDIMQEEIFGPILPILSYQAIDDAIEMIRSRKKPLALYLFTDSKVLEEKITKEVSFGGGVVNDTLIHFANTRLPFGGVGHSGMGSYTGQYSFDTFSHAKGMSRKTTLFDIAFRYPPYTNWKLNIIQLISR